MSIRVLVGSVLVCVVARLHAPDTKQLLAMLDEAERIRATDKAKSGALLSSVEADPATQRDGLLFARAQLLESKFTDAPEAALRAVSAGLPAAEKTNDLSLRAKLYVCRGNALTAHGNYLPADSDYQTA